jgi:hypothetical protein
VVLALRDKFRDISGSLFLFLGHNVLCRYGYGCFGAEQSAAISGSSSRFNQLLAVNEVFVSFGRGPLFAPTFFLALIKSFGGAFRFFISGIDWNQVLLTYLISARQY